MKAAIITQPGKLEIQDINQPKPGPFEALVKIEACGLCGTTDRHLVEGVMAHHPKDWYPAVLGHESVGKVIAIGDRVKKFKVGDRVTRPVAIWPGSQGPLYSAWGGFAEYGIVRDNTQSDGPEPDYKNSRQNVVPADMKLADAVLAISVAEVASWMEKLGSLQDKVVVIGGVGFAACVMAQCARAGGAKAIIAFGRSPKKFTWVQQNGATHALLMEDALRDKVHEIAPGGADWFLDAAGHQAVLDAGLKCLKVGGAAAIYGAPEGFTYRLPLGALGGADFSVHYFAPADDIYLPKACQRLISGDLDAEALRSHCWQGLESLTGAIAQQAQGEVLKGYVQIEQP